MLSQNTNFPERKDEENRFKDRNESYLKPNPPESLKQNSEKFAIQLRKSHRIDQIQKRRSLLNLSRVSQIFSESFKNNIDISSIPLTLIQSYPELASEQTTIMDKFLIMRTILNENSATDLVVECLEALLGISSNEEDKNKEVFFAMDFVQIFIKLMDWRNGSRVVLLATNCLLNLSTSIPYYTGNILYHQGIDALIHVISCKSLGVSYLSITTLGNLCIDFIDKPELFQNPSIFNKINELMKSNKELNTELFSSLLFYINALLISEKPQLSNQDLKLLVKWLKIIIALEETIILQEALKIIYKLSLIDANLIKSITIMNYLIKFYLHALALKAILNITYVSDEASSFFIKNFFLEKLNESLHSGLIEIRKTAFRCMNNLLLSSNDQDLINSSISPAICQGLIDSDSSIRSEAANFMSNTSQGFYIGTWNKLIDNGLFAGFQKCLDTEEDPKVVHLTLFVVFHLLMCGKNESEKKYLIGNEFVEKFENEGLYQMIEDLACHPNDEISEFAAEIIEEYFSEAATADDYSKQGAGSFKFS